MIYYNIIGISSTIISGQITVTQVSSNRVKVGQQFEVVVKFTNPLDLTLNKCVLSIEGPGIQSDLRIPIQ